MKKISKSVVFFVALAIVCFVLALYYGSQIFGLLAIICLATGGSIYVNKHEAELIESGVKTASIGELLDQKLGPREKEKFSKLSIEERLNLANQLVREIGSDTGPIKLRKYSTNN